MVQRIQPTPAPRASANAELIERDKAHLVHALHDLTAHETGRVWVKGAGAILIDADGRECIDGLAGMWNVTAGHGRMDLAQVMYQQAQTLGYAPPYSGSSNPRAVELAERLATVCYPSVSHFFFTSGGSEATESSIKLTRAYWKLQGQPEKTKVISLVGGYHGSTLGAMSATGMGPFWSLFEPRVPGFVHIPSPDPYRYLAPVGVDPGLAAANELEQAILREGPETVGMFMAEPVQGAGGVICPPPGYFPRIREICDRYDVLFVADEVITGFGRTGKLFALDHWDVEPDIVQFGKGVTSGYAPLGGIGIADRIMQPINDAGRPWMHAFTYGANPVGCAVALRMLDIIREERLTERAAEQGRYLLGALRAALGDHAHVGNIRGKGLMCAVELVQDKAAKAPFAPEDQVGIRVRSAALARGLFSRIKGDSYLLAPPLTVTTEQLDRAVEILRAAVETVLGRAGAARPRFPQPLDR